MSCTIDLEQSTTQPGKIAFQVCWSSTVKKEHLTLPILLLNFLVELLMLKSGPKVHICTHYKRDKFPFQCHPAFRYGSAIHDWMLFRTDAVGNQEACVDYFPCKLAAVVVNNALNVTNNDNKYQLIVQCTISQTGVESAFLTEWCLLPDYVIISPSSISHPSFVITIEEDQSIVMETLEYEK